MKLHLQDARDGCIDLGLGDLPIHHCLVQPKDHMLRIGQTTRAKFQAVAMLTREERTKVKADTEVTEAYRTEGQGNIAKVSSIMCMPICRRRMACGWAS